MTKREFIELFFFLEIFTIKLLKHESLVGLDKHVKSSGNKLSSKSIYPHCFIYTVKAEAENVQSGEGGFCLLD